MATMTYARQSVELVQGRVVEAILMAHGIDHQEWLVERLAWHASAYRLARTPIRDAAMCLMAVLLNGRDILDLPASTGIAYSKAALHLAHALCSVD